LHFCDLFAHTLETTFPDLGFPDLDPYGCSTLRIWDLRILTFTDLVIYGFGFTDLELTDLSGNRIGFPSELDAPVKEIGHFHHCMSFCQARLSDERIHNERIHVANLNRFTIS